MFVSGGIKSQRKNAVSKYVHIYFMILEKTLGLNFRIELYAWNSLDEVYFSSYK